MPSNHVEHFSDLREPPGIRHINASASGHFRCTKLRDHESHAAAMGSFKACNFLAATVAVFLILSAVWIWTHYPRLNVPPRRPLPAGTSKHKNLQREWVLPQFLPRIRTHEKDLESTRVDRNQLVPSISYSKLNITFERLKIDNNCSSVFISLRTTVAFHKSRLLLLLLTWLQTVNPKQVCWLNSFT